MGLIENTSGPRTYLSVGFGKLRQKSLGNGQKVNQDTPKAVCRTTHSGQQSWSLEFDGIEGIIDKIYYKEDHEYGNSYEVIIQDVSDVYQISFPEESRFCTDLLKKLPNVNFSDRLKITVYDFTKDQKRRVGTSIIQNDEKIQSFYSRQKEDKTWEMLNGMPSSIGVDFQDPDEIKMYMIKIKKFLRKEFNERILPMLESSEPPQDVEKDIKQPPVYDERNPPPPEETDDLPF